MSIHDAASAAEWLRAWGGSPRAGILAETLRGLRGARSIMTARRYSDAARADMDAALRVLGHEMSQWDTKCR